MIKNLTIFRLPINWELCHDRLIENLSVPNVLGHGWKILRGDYPLIEVQGQLLLTMETQEKLIPTSVVNKAVQLRIEKFINETGDADMAMNKKFKRDVEETVLNELYPQAFVTSKFTNIWIDTSNGFLCIDTTSEKKVDDAMKLMHKSGFPDMTRLRTKYDAGATMRKLLLSDDQSESGFNVGRSCVIAGVDGVVRYQNECLDTKDVRNHLLHGKRVKKLELTHNDLVTFTLHDNLSISRLTLLDIVKDELNDDEDDGLEDQIFDAEFFIKTREYSYLINAVIDALGGEVSSSDEGSKVAA